MLRNEIGGSTVQIIDAIVSREGANSVWARVVFLGDRGEAVSVRLPCPVPSGGSVGRVRLIKRAAGLLRNLVESDAFDKIGDQMWPRAAGRSGLPEFLVLPGKQWRGFVPGQK